MTDDGFPGIILQCTACEEREVFFERSFYHLVSNTEKVFQYEPVTFK